MFLFFENSFFSVFVCGYNGFVEFPDPHFLVSTLSWQHPKLGCYTRLKPETIPNWGIAAEFGPKTQKAAQETEAGRELKKSHTVNFRCLSTTYDIRRNCESFDLSEIFDRAFAMARVPLGR